MNKVFIEDKAHIVELPMEMREELTNKGVIPANIPEEDTELVVFGAGSWQVVWYENDKKHTYMPWTGIVTKN